MFFRVWLSIAIEWRISDLGEIKAAIPEGYRAAVIAAAQESGMDLGAWGSQAADEHLRRSLPRIPSYQSPKRTSFPGPSKASPKGSE